MAVTLTFGDVSENHVGMKKQGVMSQSGLSIETLEEAARRYTEAGKTCELIRLDQVADIRGFPRIEPAAILIVRNALDNADDMLEEQQELELDKKALMRGRVVNKQARYNLCFSDEACEPDYESGQGRVISYRDVPLLDAVRNKLPDFFGEQALNLETEGNYYYDISKCGIGFHGDGERRVVIAIRLGESIPLHYQWYYHSTPIGHRIIIDPPLRHGDLYAMSEKAAGTDWRRSSILTLRHAAGAPKYLAI